MKQYFLSDKEKKVLGVAPTLDGLVIEHAMKVRAAWLRGDVTFADLSSYIQGVYENANSHSLAPETLDILAQLTGRWYESALLSCLEAWGQR